MNRRTASPRIIIAICLAGMLASCEGGGHDWSYGKHNGPHEWTGLCSSGRFQSPIDLEMVVAHPRYFEPLVFFQYEAPANVTIKNNGHTLTLTLHQPCTAQMAGGGLPSQYSLAQVHFHWGSEHTVGNTRFPLEAHFVHYNRRKFSSLQAAVGQEDGLAVLGVLYHESSEHNEAVDRLLAGVSDVTQEGAELALPAGLRLEQLLPHDTGDFFRYRGSLTTPACNEGVLWTVLRAFAPISPQQVEKFQTLKSQAGKLEHNFRPIQPLNERVLYVRALGAASMRSASFLLVCACAMLVVRLVRAVSA